MVVRYRPHDQAGHGPIPGQAPLDEHGPTGGVECCGALVDTERRRVVHPLVERAALRPQPGYRSPAKLARSATLPKV